MEAQRRQAEKSVVDLTRNIQRKKDRELEALQLNGTNGNSKPQTVVNKTVKVGPNDPCPCGSGKKYKKCHRLLE